MLEINYWFFVQLANVVLLFIILNAVLFKPFLRLFREREESTKGFLDTAKETDKKKDDVLAQIDAKLSAARDSARATFDELSREGMEIQKRSLEEAQNEAVDINRKAKADLEAAAEKARAKLKSDIETFSKQIVEKLVGA